MSGKRYTEAFKIDAVKQVTDRGYSVVEVADRLGISIKSLYAWKAKYGDPKRSKDVQQNQEQRAEIARLKAEVRRLTEERDILKKATAYFAKESD